MRSDGATGLLRVHWLLHCYLRSRCANASSSRRAKLSVCAGWYAGTQSELGHRNMR